MVADTHGLEVAAVPEPVSVVVAPTHALLVPEIVAALGWVTVTPKLAILPVLDFT